MKTISVMNKCKLAQSTPKFQLLIERLSEIRAALRGEAESTNSVANRLSKNNAPVPIQDIKLVDAVCFSTALEQEIQLLTNTLESHRSANLRLHKLV
jgi:hypothetical protein